MVHLDRGLVYIRQQFHHADLHLVLLKRQKDQDAPIPPYDERAITQAGQIREGLLTQSGPSLTFMLDILLFPLRL
jgi:hypothetical protein